jgi:magnesium chelatase subunit D
VVEAVSSLCVDVGAEGLRADLTICRAAAALAGWEGRPTVSATDVRRVAPLALAHRARRDPLEPAGMDEARLGQALDAHLGREETTDGSGGPEAPDAEDVRGPQSRQAAFGDGRRDPADPVDPPAGSEPPGPPAAEDDPPGQGTADPTSPGQRTADPAPTGVAPPALGDYRGPSTAYRPATGRRGPAESQRGRLVGDRAPDGSSGSVAIGATVRRVAARRASAGGPSGAAVTASGSAVMRVAPEDLREAVRVDRTANLVVLAVDASGSMGAPQRMESAKGAVLGLLTDAYQRRDLVGLVAFRGDDAQVLLRPTGSVEVARARLVALPTGGRTPLAVGITTALRLLSSPARLATHRPVLVVVTDGRATSGPGGADPVAAAGAAADAVRRAGVEAVVIDVEGAGAPGDPAGAVHQPLLGMARDLAARMGGRHVPVAALTPDVLRQAVRWQPGGMAP